ncbi:hypothetical protein D3C71_1947030 [compost metagenome]
MVVNMGDAPEFGRYEIADKAGDECGNQRLMRDQPDRQHLQPEHRTRQRRSEDGAEAAADAADQQNPAVRRADAQRSAEPFGETAAHLYRRPFTAG